MLLNLNKMTLASLLLILIVAVASSAECPAVWTVYNSASGQCECGNWLSGVVTCVPRCQNDTHMLILLRCYCMTYSEVTNITAVGPCFVRCGKSSGPHTAHAETYAVDANSTLQLNNHVCGPFKRTGQLCGKCTNGYGFPVYSYSLICIECKHSDLKLNIAKYLTVAFLPLTVLYFVVMTFKISISSGHMAGYILACQIIGSPISLASTLGQGNHYSMKQIIVTKTAVSLILIWNLDFFRAVYFPFCISPELSAIQVHSLDYLVAVYPLFLILLTYIAVSLHDRYSIVVKMWRPAYKVFSCMRREWNIRGSMIEAFATFLTLSYVKILNVSFKLLLPVHLKDVYGEVLNNTYLFNDAEMVYFGHEHLPYGVLAIAMLTIFNLLPMTLLLLYPCRCFQRCLNRCGVRSQLLHIFMDAFQGCYRHKSRDCRYFTGIYFFFRVLFLTTFGVINDLGYVTVTGFYFIALAILVLYAEPYKKPTQNKRDIVIFLLSSLACSLVSSGRISSYKFQDVISAIVLFSFLLYGNYMISNKLIPFQPIVRRSQNCMHGIWKRWFSRQATNDKAVANDPFPYQFEREQERLLT